MTNSKKNSKSIIALVVMALLLVASIVLAATGAWFTQLNKGAEKNISFGKVDVAVNDNGYGFYRGAAETDTLMPGDTIKAKLTLTRAADSDDVWYTYTISVKVDGTEMGKTSATPVKLTGTTAVDIDASVELEGAKYGNYYETKAVVVSYEVRMVQAANVADEAAAKEILNADNFAETAAADYKGVTV